MKISLRLADETDLDFLIELRTDTMTQYMQDMNWPTDKMAMVERVRLDYDCANIIEVDGKMAGLFKVKFRPQQNQWYVVQIQVHPSFQNKKIGRTLILELFELAKITASSVALGVLKTNPAQHLYYHLGFVKVAETDAEYLLEYRSSAG
ncbi:GNAT family N-acetyltransferase [Vibrio hippocampi]|uniref:N-acetyltransferase domain-containing protein n=1 Tax=Vibrio hippocampi TaxID=654686 RepID=A0ABN8DMD5_9VIBR|nr:GNAT family N-acetyltransferase [Vibrio hippocampi]CAH0529815.1 hypothetical protein VHP8226_03571 [Vibrio hippocampi]